jgi:hypothetical protein
VAAQPKREKDREVLGGAFKAKLADQLAGIDPEYAKLRERGRRNARRRWG